MPSSEANFPPEGVEISGTQTYRVQADEVQMTGPESEFQNPETRQPRLRPLDQDFASRLRMADDALYECFNESTDEYTELMQATWRQFTGLRRMIEGAHDV